MTKKSFTQLPDDVIEALALYPLKSSELKVILLIVRQTLGWQKEADWISRKQFCEATRLGKRAVGYALKNLKSLNIVLEVQIRAPFKGLAINLNVQSWKGVHKYALVQEHASDGEQDCLKGGNKSATTKERKETKQKKESEEAPFFQEFWNIYPRKEAKVNARKAFKRINPSEEEFKIILSALEKKIKSHDWKKEDGHFIPHPASWLNGERWLDEVKTTSSKTKFRTIPIVKKWNS